MEYTYAVGCLFLGLVLVCAQGQSQYRGSICKRLGSDDCKLPLDCGQGRISILNVETGYSICNPTACKFCCNVNLMSNQNLTKEVKQYCEDLYQCEPGSLILASPGVGNAIIWFACKEVECPYYTYGHRCTPCGQCKDGSCDPVNGECPYGCFDGYFGKTCERLITVNSVKSEVVSTVTAGYVEASVMSNITAGIVGAVVGVVTTILVVAIILAVLWTIKRRVPIYEQPLAMVSVDEAAYDTLQDQSKQNLDDTGSNPVYGNTI